MEWLRQIHMSLMDTIWFPLWIIGVVFVLVFFRYVVIAGPAYLVFWKWLRERMHHRRIQQKFPKAKFLQQEFLWSLSTFVVFGMMGCLLLWLNRNGYTRHYANVSDYGWGYYVLSIGLMIIIHDAYFYWTHRTMHHKALFRYFHRVHHVSHNPSPWAAFSFHPLEAVVESGIVVVFGLILPHHLTALGVFLVLMTVINVLGHLGYELYPKGFATSSVGRWITTSTHHNMHHHRGKGNFGLYFNCWDRWMGTLHHEYEETYHNVTHRDMDTSKSDTAKATA